MIINRQFHILHGAEANLPGDFNPQVFADRVKIDRADAVITVNFCKSQRCVVGDKGAVHHPTGPGDGELKARISGINLASSGEMVLALEPLSITNSPVAFFPDVGW